MPAQVFFMAASIAILLIIGYLFYLGMIKRKKLTPLSILASAFVISGMLSGKDQDIGYCLIGIGLVMAVADMVLKLKK